MTWNTVHLRKEPEMIEAFISFIFLTLLYIAYLLERLNNNIYLMMDGVRLIPGAITDLRKEIKNHNERN